MKIFIATPAKIKTGGTELLHQLSHELNISGMDSYIFYYNSNDSNPMDKSFKQYTTQYITKIDEEDNNAINILIVSETKTSLIYEYPKMQRYIWWLSVDNYFKCLYSYRGITIQRIKNIARKLLNRAIVDISSLDTPKKAFTFGKNQDDIIHLCQSYYAMDFLKKNNINNAFYLSDYINPIYLTTRSSIIKENIVLYNPKKGKKFTNQIIKFSKDLKWIPLINLSNEEVKALLFRSKVYIDFGNHPGKDRFPREAAACGCCIITGKKGAAKYVQDVSIASEFKFNDDEKEISKIVSKIRTCLYDYDNQINKFEDYRNYIFNENNNFKNDVTRIFKMKNEHE